MSWTVTFDNLEPPQGETSSTPMPTKEIALEHALNLCRRQKCEILRINGPGVVLEGTTLEDALKSYAADHDP